MKLFYARVLSLKRSLLIASLLLTSAGGYSQITYTVINNFPVGGGSLNAAITAANASPGPDIIVFAMPGPFVIVPGATPLPQITDPVSIQGYTQPGSVQGLPGARTLVVDIDFTGQANGFDFAATAAGSDISGIAMSGAANANIIIQPGLAGGVHIWGCHIGTNAAGNAAGYGVAPITASGIQVGNGTVAVTGVSIGTNADGVNDANEGNVIGSIGATALGNGVLFDNVSGSRVAGNYIGIGANGTANVGNGFGGIVLQGGSTGNIIGLDDAAVAATADQINYIGFNGAGVAIFQNSNTNTVAGNFIGVDPAGGNAGQVGTEPNAGNGVMIVGASSNTIGTDADGVKDADEANTIGFNSGDGVIIRCFDPNVAPYPTGNGFDASNNLVKGNLIGTGTVGAAVKANAAFGVIIVGTDNNNVTGNIIGSDGVGTNGAVEANTIVNNQLGGAVVTNVGIHTGLRNTNRISRNSFLNNFPTGFGPWPSITLNGDLGLTPNDCGDADAGSNDLFNRPILETITSDATNLYVTGWAAAGSTIELYVTGPTTPIGIITPPGGISTLPFGELSSYLTSFTEGSAGDLDATTSLATDDGTGVTCTLNKFSFTIPLGTLEGPYASGNTIAAIAFDAASGAANTSEPSPAVTATAISTTFIVTNTLDAGAGSLRQAILDANANANAPIVDIIQFAIPGAGVQTIAPATPLPAITGPVSIQGYTQPGSAAGAIGSRTVLIELNANASALATGLSVTSSGVTISGLTVSGATGNNILVGPGLNTIHIWGCHIGTNAAGTAAGFGAGVGANGISIGDGTTANTGVTIGSNVDGTDDANEGNVIGSIGTGVGVFGNGVLFNNVDDSRIAGNYLGLGSDGTAAVGSGFAGINLQGGSTGNIIGLEDGNSEATAVQVNYIGNNGVGIALFQNSNSNIITGNYIGVNPTGGAAGQVGGQPDAGNGIMIIGASTNQIGTDADGVKDADEANTIGFNGGDGIIVRTFNPGTAPYPAGNGNDASGNLIKGNLIGTGLVGAAVKANTGWGVAIAGTDDGSANDNIIGSDGVGTNGATEANIISNNQLGGVSIAAYGVHTGTLTGNRISQNTITDNDNGVYPDFVIPIVLNDALVPTPNDDATDADAGPNTYLNRPVINTVTFSNPGPDAPPGTVVGTLTITGWAPAGATLELYKSTRTGVPNLEYDFAGGAVPNTSTLAFGDLSEFLASVTVPAGTGGSAYPDDGTGVSFTENAFTINILNFPVASLAAGDQLVGVLIDGAGNTSEASTVNLNALVLPVSYLSFNGMAENKIVKLTWETAQEQNSKQFDVERSADGSTFTSIGTVAAKGNSNVTSSYRFDDLKPLSVPVAYYRLKQIDLDGKFAYSKTILVKSSWTDKQITLAPNPVQSNMVISLVAEKAGTVSIKLVDNNGRVVRNYRQQVTDGPNQIRLNDLGTLPRGMYFIQITGQSTLLNEKIIKY